MEVAGAAAAPGACLALWRKKKKSKRKTAITYAHKPPHGKSASLNWIDEGSKRGDKSVERVRGSMKENASNFLPPVVLGFF